MLYANRGFPFTPTQMCQLAYDMAEAEGKSGFSPVKKTAGRKWLKFFFKRHPEVRIKNSQNLSISRAISANPGSIKKFFEQLREWVADWKLEFEPNRIWNVDECGVGDIPKTQRVVGVTGHRAFQTVAAEKAANTTIVTYVSAGGLATKPMVILKAAKVHTDWREAAPSGYFMKSSASGYINGNLFLKYGEQFVNFLKERHLLDSTKKIMVLLDLHKSHLFNYDFMQLMKRNNIELCGFPPSCTHMLQPLDDVPFGNFKRVYQRELLDMNRRLCGNRMSKTQFFRVLIPAVEEELNPEAIRKGFKNCGVYPINPKAEKLSNIGASTVFDRCKFLLGKSRGVLFDDKRVTS